jgi:hypothetical protein
MASPSRKVVMDDLRGGMNGVDDPLTLQENECLYALNVDWFRSTCGHKRHGSTATAMTSSTMTGKVSSLIRHVPGVDETAMELWAVDDAATPVVNRLAGGTSWAAPTLKDNITGNGWDVHGASVDGKLFLAYKSAVNRLHCWDGSTVRRAGINPGSTAPTAGNTGGGGAYTDTTPRYYRVRFYAGTFARVSEATPSVAFTPSGAGDAVRVTRPTAPNEGETSWALEASTDNVSFYQIGLIVIGTTTFDDVFPAATYAAGNFFSSPPTGQFTVQKPYKFIAGADNRLLGFGSHNSSDPQHRVEFSAIVGGVTLGISGVASDDAAERVDTTGGYYVDLDESDSGVPTGLAGPVNGNYYAFKTNQVWELRPTGDVTQPFAATAISKVIGAVGQQAIVKGEDALGRPCLYFMSQVGPYRYGANGLEYIGRKVDNYIRGVAPNLVSQNTTLKLSPSSVGAIALYYPAKRQVWWWFAVNETSDASGPTRCLLYDVLNAAWAEYTGITSTRAVALFSTSIGASMGKDLVPFMARSSSNNVIWRLDDSSVGQDAGTSYQGYIMTRPIEPGGPGMLGNTSDLEVVLFGATPAGPPGSLQVRASADLNTSLQVTTTALYGVAASHLWLRVSGAELADVHVVHYEIGDVEAVDNAWRIERITIVAHPQEAFIA